jgi:hypothetical protein
MEEMSLMVLQLKKNDVCSDIYNNNTHNSGNILNDNFSVEQTENMKMLCFN